MTGVRKSPRLFSSSSMSGRGGYGSRGGRGGNFSNSRGGRGGFSGRGGGYGKSQEEYLSPDQIQLQRILYKCLIQRDFKFLAMGNFLHACEGDMICESINEKIPYFNAPIYLENKTQIGRVDEILGPVNQVVPTFHIILLYIFLL